MTVTDLRDEPPVAVLAKAREAVTLVATRLADPDTVARIAGDDGNREPIVNAAPWEPLTLSTGLPGIVLFYAELARTDARWLSVAHRHMRRAARLMASSPSRGLHAGPASLLTAAQSCAAATGEGRYARLRRDLAGWLATDQQRRLDDFAARSAPGVPWAAYDVINGMSGTGRLLLDVVDDPAEDSAAARQALDRTLRHLVRLSEPITVDGTGVPGWWVPAGLQPIEQDRQTYPRGDFNLGLAHGAAGPLALLSLAARRGHEVPGQHAAVARIADWLTGWARSDECGAYWPCRVSWDEQVAPDRPGTAFTRTAWCYGAPGVASALYLAGAVHAVDAWRQAAVGALRAALTRPERRWHLDGPTVCHGLAGFVQVLWRVGTASGDRHLIAGAARVARRMLDFLDPRAPFGFAHLVPDSPRGWQDATGHRALNVAGILEGAAGVACTLLPFLGDAPGTDRAWDRCLALS
ncbi:lanthionine synthetase C family protein [Actinoplanes teichomyceticus]|uniref:Lanthionine synthetase-like protein n=1 Tax=Actinoplanes teichomyceticus TaxID=1867 RepID=A0A561VLZ4_ACTTI|nr:lanthionine synthetase C family protein [Actinoplanes teichomyceticus]TWG12649.1 lanthionine synthetase-like protein [Actinoplanes teichomyceticus]GIF13381.1 hypothetical protein Ate01nite_34130 [Actinoplanes teichomyceticus]